MIKKTGFTIMELLIVAVVFFIMILVLAPFVKMARGRAIKMQCASNLRELSLGLHAYAVDHNDVFPAKLSDLYPNYVANEKTFDCPASKIEGLSKSPDYSYASNLRESSDSREAIVADLDGNHKKLGKNILRVDGSVEWVR